MITHGMCNSYKLECQAGIHQLGDTYKIALFSADADLGPQTTLYDPTDEVVGPGYDAGGKVLEGATLSLVGNTSILDFGVNPEWPMSTITAHGALIYNASKGNRAVGAINFGSNISSTNAPFKVTLPPPTELDGLIAFR